MSCSIRERAQNQQQQPAPSNSLSALDSKLFSINEEISRSAENIRLLCRARDSLLDNDTRTSQHGNNSVVPGQRDQPHLDSVPVGDQRGLPGEDGEMLATQARNPKSGSSGGDQHIQMVHQVKQSQIRRKLDALQALHLERAMVDLERSLHHTSLKHSERSAQPDESLKERSWLDNDSDSGRETEANTARVFYPELMPAPLRIGHRKRCPESSGQEIINTDTDMTAREDPLDALEKKVLDGRVGSLSRYRARGI
jgi:hypothetical protein